MYHLSHPCHVMPQRILLSRGADPRQVLMNKEYEQDLSRILHWGVQITTIATDDGKGEPVADWEVRSLLLIRAVRYNDT